MNTDLKTFFESLAERKRKENDLSDITYALCNSNEDFKKFFLKFCFDEDLDTRDFVREYANDDSRPDFFFHDLENNECLIEVKIYDHNQHFDQYEKKFNKLNTKYAFIANYPIEPREKWKIKSWQCFLKSLTESKLKNDLIISGYIDYLKLLTNTKEFKKMNLNECKSLPIFLENCKTILIQEFNFSEYNASKSCNEDYYGQFFSKEKLYFWIGIYLSENNIYIGFNDDKNWVPYALQKNLKNLVNKKTDIYWVPEENQDGNYGKFWFGMKKIDVLCDNNKSIDEQKQVLKEFIVEVFKSIGAEKYLK